LHIDGPCHHGTGLLLSLPCAHGGRILLYLVMHDLDVKFTGDHMCLDESMMHELAIASMYVSVQMPSGPLNKLVLPYRRVRPATLSHQSGNVPASPFLTDGINI